MTRAARGAALLLVLWMLLLMAGLIAVFALGTRTEALQGSALRQQVAARLAAEAGIELASLRLVEADPAARWVPDGRPQRFEFDGYQVEVRVQDEAAKMDLNAADAGQLAALMGWLGVEPDRAERLAGVIQDWRDADSLLAVSGGAEDRDYAAAGLEYGAKDQPFTTLGELQQLLGMDLATYRLLAPHVTVYTAMPSPDMSLAQLPVLQAMGLAPAQVAELLALRQAWRPGLPLPLLPDGSTLAVNGSGTYSVASRATRPDGTLVEVHATLRIGAGSGFGQLYAPLAWRTGEPY
ncbi:MAG TPA: type II secretion system minor pseudopilin GspK [Arenimonas sp.]|uniref:general secretion pathway protein GspK n=1 Tax=Arenimonas sp. TaxID=1872635 RepID=UPI002D810F59|nr:type II secretion system minor pseudopilin GspK [Arenimonas sp.]HEU0151904.1 type II secretion system minor pseudopilin GspK [Arenimonas sp.]